MNRKERRAANRAAKKTKRVTAPDLATLWGSIQSARRIHEVIYGKTFEKVAEYAELETPELWDPMSLAAFLEGLHSVAYSSESHARALAEYYNTSQSGKLTDRLRGLIKGDSSYGGEGEVLEIWTQLRWLRTPTLYRPHPDLAQAVMDSDPPDRVPYDALAGLQGATWAVVLPEGQGIKYAGGDYRYVVGALTRIPGSSGKYTGITTIAWDVGTLRLLRDAQPLDAHWYVQVIREARPVIWCRVNPDDIRGTYDAAAEEERAVFRVALNFGLYLASESPDVDLKDWKPASSPVPNGPRASVPKHPVLIGIGSRIGPRLGSVLRIGEREEKERHAAQQNGRASPVAHFRRGHWKSVWHGPRQESQPGTHRVVTWIAPTVVGKGPVSPTERKVL